MKNTDVYKHYTKQVYRMNELISEWNQLVEKIAGIPEEDVTWNDCGILSYIIEKYTEINGIVENKK